MYWLGPFFVSYSFILTKSRMKNRTWTKYLLEIVVIVIGILIALGMDNLNDSRKQRILETELLNEVLVSVKRDSADIEHCLRIHRIVLHSQQMIVDWLSSEAPYSDSLCRHFAAVQRKAVFVANENPYETIKSLGIRIISSKEVRDGISLVYDTQYEYYQRMEIAYRQLVMHMVNNVFPKYFDHTEIVNIDDPDLIGCITPIDVNKIRSENELKHHLKTIRSYNEFLVHAPMSEALNAVKELITLLEAELADQ